LLPLDQCRHAALRRAFSRICDACATRAAAVAYSDAVMPAREWRRAAMPFQRERRQREYAIAFADRAIAYRWQ